MSSIDERVVAMKFNNGQFENGIKRTLDSLGLLKKGLNLDGATKGLQDLDAAGKRFSLAGMANGVDKVSAKFVALATIGITALANIANRAVNAGATLIKSLTVEPIQQGLKEYETNLNAIQTILANTQSKGTTLSNVNDALQELNEYSDKTIYNFAEMARNIGTFTAAGVGLDASTSAIKGIANLAAVSGSSSAQASTAMYQLSQALATGRVSLMDWNSVVNAGMGGEVFQENLKETARVHGVAVDQIIDEQGSFRDSLSEGWLTSEILTEALSKMTGDLTDQQLEAMGYTREQIVEIQKMAQTAQDAATKVKTVSQLIGTLQEAAGSGWAQTWQLVFGDFEEAKELFTNVNDVLGGMIGASADARNKVLGDWKALGGRTVIIEAISNAFNSVMDVIKPVKEAFREIFPPATGQQLYNISVAIRDFTERLKVSAETSDALKRTFKGVFAVFDIFGMVIKGFLGVIGSFLGELSKSTGGVLDFTAGIGDFLVSVRDAIKEGQGLTKFFDTLKTVVKIPIEALKLLAGWLRQIFGGEGIASDGMEIALTRLQERFEPLRAIGEALSGIWDRLGGVFQRVQSFLKPLTDAMWDFFGGISSAFSESVQNMDFSTFLDAINTGLLAGLLLIFKKFLSGGVNVDLGGGFLGSIGESFQSLTGVLKSMQTQIKAEALLKIAGAIGILTLSVVALSLIDSARLTAALAAMTVMFTQLFAALAVFEKTMTGFGVAKMAALGAGLILLATAMVILSGSVAILARLEWEELAKGLLGVTVLLGALVAAAKGLSGSAGGLMRAGAGLLVVAIAIKVLASAVKDFAEMDWGEMVRGFAGVSAALVALGLFTKLVQVNKGAIASSAGLILLGIALKILASAVGDFAGMNWDELGRGFAGMAAALVIIAGAIRLIPLTIVVTAGGLVAVAAALVIVAQALQMMGGMTWEEIAKGLVTLAGSLLIIAGAMYLMSAALPGAAALIVVAAALAILTPVLLALGGMSWEEIGKGLLMLAASFAVIGLAGLVLAPLVPVLIGLGLAVALIGVGAMAAGIGILAFSVGLTALAAASAVGTAAIVAMVGAIIGLIPMAMQALATGIVLFVGVIAQSGPQFVLAITAVLMALIQSIRNVGPAVIDTLFTLVMKLVNTLASNVPKFVDAGLRMITGILNGIAKNLNGIITAATNIVVAFLKGISNNLPRVIQAGIDLILKFVNSLADGIRNNTARMQSAGRNLASAIIDGMTGGLFSGASRVVQAAKDMAGRALSAAKNFLGISSPSKAFGEVGEWSGIGYALALDKTSHVVERSAAGVGKTALSSLKATMSNVADLVATDIDFSPTIRPVLDLSNVRKGAGMIDGILKPASIVPTSSYNKAATIAVESRAAQRALSEERFGTQQTREESFTFIQNNSSPKALSTGEIYRHTKNQISVVKGALPK